MVNYGTFYHGKTKDKMRDFLDKREEDIHKNEDYFLSLGLSDKDKKTIDTVLKVPYEQKKSLEDVFIKSAELAGRSHDGYKLYPAQIDPVLMSYINPRLFIADSAGLGKTIEAGGVYAYYRLQQIKKGLPVKKIIVVAETSHVIGFQKTWKKLGINLLPLYDGNAKIKKQALEFNDVDFDGIVISWSSIKTNEFVNFWLENHSLFDIGIFDETACLRNPTSQIYRMTDTIINKYQNGLSRAVFLNGTPFEINIYDYYYQFNILKPKLIPSKSWLDARYVIKEGRQVVRYERGLDGSKSLVSRNTGVIVDYKNQKELRERLRYFLIGRTKEDFQKEKSIPKHSYILHLAQMTKEQYRILDVNADMSLINSPETSNPDKKLTVKNSPKLQRMLDFIPKVISDKPLIYAENIKSQETICNLLLSQGYRVEILNGLCDVEEKHRIISDFEKGELDALVFNIKKSISLPSSDRIIFYDIPYKPSDTVQISARIDRDNYEISKFYDFFCYMDSPEMANLILLAYFREKNSNAFTGKNVEIYSQLVEQIADALGKEEVEKISDKVDILYENNKEDEVYDMLLDFLQI